jgi:hypothetical protein
MGNRSGFFVALLRAFRGQIKNLPRFVPSPFPV